MNQQKTLVASMIAALFLLGCSRVPVVDRERNIIDGVPVLGSNKCCPPETYPDGEGNPFGEIDRRRYGPQLLCDDDSCTQLESWHDGADCDGRWLVLERLIGRKRVTHCSPLHLFGCCEACSVPSYGPPRNRCYDQSVVASAFVFFTFDNSETVDGLRIRDVDIVAYDGQGCAVYVDGSDIGLSEVEIDAFHILDDTHILMSFAKDFTVDGEHALPGLSGDVDNSDVLIFTANSLGPITRGTFGMYMDGSDLGLDEDRENIDAFCVDAEGRMVFSTSGTLEAGELKATDADLILFEPESLGEDTKGSLVKYLDLKQIDPNESIGDINALDIGEDGRIYFSASTDFQTSDGIQVSSNDVFSVYPSSNPTEETNDENSFHLIRGIDLGIIENDLIALDVPGTSSFSPVPPNVDAANLDNDSDSSP